MDGDKVLPPVNNTGRTYLLMRKKGKRETRMLKAFQKIISDFSSIGFAKENWQQSRQGKLRESVWKGTKTSFSQLEALGAGVSDEDANHKFLRSLPPAWDSLAMTMRTKKNIDTLSIE
ncbi:hypothetical protein Tco_0382043 [Tanacetum coccineum]